MKNSIRFIVSIVLVSAFFFNALPDAMACGPFTLSPIFSLKNHADFPLLEFTGGKTGIVPDSFGQMSLFVFYRRLNNLPLTNAEQEQIVEAMETQIYYRSGRYDTSVNSESEPEKVPNYFEKWLEARARITNEKRDIETEKQIAGDYHYFSNCLPDAFHNATKTLEARIAKYGAGNELKEWLKGQDAVFANCGGASGLPEALDEKSPEWLRRDRDYQIAAAQFYAGDFPGARETFEKIAADENSIWKYAAKFVAARTLIREASFITSEENEAAVAQADRRRKELLEKASEKLHAIIADDSMRDFHQSADRLVGLVKFRLTPKDRQKELAEKITRPAEVRNFYDDLTDYAWLLDFTARTAYDKGSEIDRLEAEKAGRDYDYNYVLKLRDVPAENRADELTDWIFTYQAADGFDHAFSKWKETGKLQWLVAAVGKAEAKTAQTPEILREADKIQPDSAAFATVRYHQVRLLLETGNRAEAKQKLADIIENHLKNLPLSAKNLFFAQRMTLAENLEEFLRFAQRKPVIFEWNETEREEGVSLKTDEYLSAWENRAMFDQDAVAFINEKMPLAVLRQAALSPELPPHLKRFFVIAVWTRAFALGNQAVEREFTPLMTRSAKEFSPYFSKYAAATNSTNREAAGLLTVLRYPVIQPFVPFGFGREDQPPTSIDSNRGNWWCAEAEYKEDRNLYGVYPFKYPSVYPDFLSEAQMAAAGRERKQLVSMGNSATLLARRAVEFANKYPNHPQTPEVLHFAVRSTRYGCTDDETGKYSKQAFDILHKRYPKSVWTKQTPYWFS